MSVNAQPTTPKPQPGRRRPANLVARLVATLAATLALIAGAGLAATAVAAGPVPVRTQPLHELMAESERSVPARVEALNRSQLSAEISARVETIPVRIGDPVEAGGRLLDLDCRTQQSVLAAARAAEDESRARLVFAEHQLARALDLQKQRNISEELAQQRQSDRDVIQAQGRALTEARRQAEIQVERCVLRAPYAAWVVARRVGVGELASPGQVLLELVQRDVAEVSAAIRDEEAASLQQAESPAFVYAGQRLDLRLRRLLPVIDGVSRVREARLEFRDRALPPGAAGRLSWRPRERLIRAEYLVQRADQLGIFVLDGDRARFQVLDAAIEGQPALVGLAADTAVITEGRQRLQDGDRVLAPLPADAD